MNDFYYGLASGSTGNAGLLVLDNTYFLIDLGVSVRRLKSLLDKQGITIENLDAVLITHEHSDHIKGLATFVKSYDTPIYTACGTAEVLLQKYPNAREQLRPFYCGASFEVGDVKVTSFATPHDAADSVGFRFTGKRCKFGYLTDVGFIPASVYEALVGCHAVVLESNYDPEMLYYGPYPPYLQERVSGPRGHLSNFDCAKFAAALVRNGTKQLILSHLSEKNNTPDMVRREIKAVMLAERLSCTLMIAPKDEMKEPIRLAGKEHAYAGNQLGFRWKTGGKVLETGL